MGGGFWGGCLAAGDGEVTGTGFDRCITDLDKVFGDCASGWGLLIFGCWELSRLENLWKRCREKWHG